MENMENRGNAPLQSLVKELTQRLHQIIYDFECENECGILVSMPTSADPKYDRFKLTFSKQEQVVG